MLGGVCWSGPAPAADTVEPPPAWAVAYREKAMTVPETLAFMRRLTQYVIDHHLQQDENSLQRGMIYEYFDTTRPRGSEPFTLNEGLDTMRGGAWFASALVNAYRATGDAYYKELLLQKVLPFYLKLLKHGDSMLLRCSNQMAQDLGVMLQQAWLLLKDSPLAADRKVTAELAAAANNLHTARLQQSGHIPMVCAPTALANKLPDELRRLPDGNGVANWKPANAYWRALYDFKPGQRIAMPGFADDQEYRFYHGIARHAGELPKPLAFRMLYDAYTGPLLYRCSSDDAEVPPGINRFDLHPYYFRDGKPEDYRSDRERPAHQPRSIGSRFGPQNMVCAGWALQILRAYPGLWEARYERDYSVDLRMEISDWPPGATFHDAVPSLPVKLNRVLLNIQSTRTTLQVRGQSEVSEVAIQFLSLADGAGTYAMIVIKSDNTLVATNNIGEALLVKGDVNRAGEGFQFKLELPYTFVKGQKQWGNVVEQGRCSIQIGKTSRNLYFASSETQVRVWLEHELGRGLRTWAAIFKEKGYIPTGLGAGSMPGGGKWENLSDAGGCAHLISACAEWLLYLREKKDWELQNVPVIAAAD